MLNPSRLGMLLALLGAVSASTADAQWMPNGVSVSGGNFGDVNPVVSDGSGGAYVAWRVYSPLTDNDVYLQHLTPAGTIWPGWPTTGIPLATAPFSQSFGAGGLIPDGEGGAFTFWKDFQIDPVSRTDVVYQRTRANGTPYPGWPAQGLRIHAPRAQYETLAATDGAGGLFVMWNDDRYYPVASNEDVFALHLTGDGQIAPGWPADGLPIAVNTAYWSGVSNVVPDGDGGVFFIYYDSRNGTSEAFGVRLHADGTVAGGWPTEGLRLAPLQLPRVACSDGAGGFFLWTTTLGRIYDSVYSLRRFGPDGLPAPGWPSEGIVFCSAPDDRVGDSMISDGQGGVIVSWTDYRLVDSGGPISIYALRILSNGTIAPGWQTNGTRIDDPASPDLNVFTQLAPDDMGGAYVVWWQNGPAAIHHLTGAGQPAPGWPRYGMRLATTPDQPDARITSDGGGGAIVAWHESCCGRLDVWAQRYVADGIVSTQLSLVSAVAEADRVRLEWLASGAPGFIATVERRDESAEWRALATVTADGTGHLRYEDRDVRAGSRYVYRLRYSEEGLARTTTETTVEIPAAFELALDGFRPHPAVGSPLVSFTLPRSGGGRLELFDLAGRRVGSRELAGLPPGRHMLRLGEGAALPPAAYVLRLTHGGQTMTSRGVVVR